MKNLFVAVVVAFGVMACGGAADEVATNEAELGKTIPCKTICDCPEDMICLGTKGATLPQKKTCQVPFTSMPVRNCN